MTSIISEKMATELAKQVMGYCETLAQYTQTKGAMDRRYLTLEHKQANNQIKLWAESSGLIGWQDEAGNQWVRLPAHDHRAKRVILGSHLDTVPNGGIYDGILGVVAPLVLIKYWAEHQIAFQHHIDVVGFGDEEGSRFGTTLLGSSAISGKWQSRWRELKDENQISLAQAMLDFGLDVSKVSAAQVESGQVAAYLELHIEQGPILEEKNLAIAAVNGIAGAKRYLIELEGTAGHAGTVPMALRSDPLVLISQWISQLNANALSTSAEPFPVLATVGRLNVFPGGVNVIPGKVECSLDVRSLSDERRDCFLKLAFDHLSSLASKEGFQLIFREIHSAKAVQCNPEITERLLDSVHLLTGQKTVLTSGAGHDAMVMADIVPTTMLFLRCKAGISHSPEESIDLEDVSIGLRAMANFLSTY